MDDIETLLEKLNQQAIENATRIDPAFQEKVQADRGEIEEHEKRLETQRAAAQREEPPKTEWHELWKKMRS